MIRRRLPEHQPQPRRRLLPDVPRDLVKALGVLADEHRTADPLPDKVMGRLLALGLAKAHEEVVSYRDGTRHRITHQMLTDLGKEALTAAPAKNK